MEPFSLFSSISGLLAPVAFIFAIGSLSYYGKLKKELDQLRKELEELKKHKKIALMRKVLL